MYHILVPYHTPPHGAYPTPSPHLPPLPYPTLTPQPRHKSHPSPLPTPPGPPRPNMLPQPPQHLTPLPPSRHRPIRRPIRPQRLRPLPLRRLHYLPLLFILRRLPLCVGCGGRSRLLGLGSPVVDVPVILVEETIVFGHLGGCHGGEVRVGEGGEEEVGFADAAFAGLVWRWGVSFCS